tara:strand:- start:276 stop:410 length:135 start_codon:yes stop_codon:yes gene_type:complete
LPEVTCVLFLVGINFDEESTSEKIEIRAVNSQNMLWASHYIYHD